MNMSNITLAFIAYVLDRIFGELRCIKHPVIIMGDAIKWFEKHFYHASVVRGLLLLVFVVSLTAASSFIIVYLLAFLAPELTLALSALIAAMFLAHKMLYDVVLSLTSSVKPKEELAMLVSRDTADLSQSDVCKAGIETYAENLSDGVIAPLLYLLLFGLPGIMIYKAVNTLDSMVGYRTERFEKYGKASAKLDDVLNFIPARITALMIMLVSKPLKLFAFYKQGKKHESPNAGLPITAMALAIDVKLGGPTAYFNSVKKKAFFGQGKELLDNKDIVKSLKIGKKLDFLVIFLLILALLMIKM